MSNLTNLSTSTLPPSPSAIPVQFYDILVNIVGCLITGSLGFVTNSLALLVIYQNKRLHTPCFLLMAGECVSCVLMAAGVLFSAIDSMGQQIGWFPKTRSRGVCYVYQSLLPSLTTTVSALIACLISVDRLISILIPIWYRKVGKKYAVVCLVLCTLFSISAAMGGLLAGPDLTSVISCAKFSDAFGSIYNSYYKGVNLVVSVGCLVAYLILLVSFTIKSKRITSAINSTTGQANLELKTFSKQQATVMPAVKLLMILYTVTGVCPTIIGNVLTYIENGRYFPRGYQYNYVLKSCNPMAEVLALFLRSKEFREGLLRLLSRKNGVGAVTTSVKANSRPGALHTSGLGDKQERQAMNTIA